MGVQQRRSVTPVDSGGPEKEIESQAAIEVTSTWPRISIVTPSLNQAKFIRETIDSVLTQEYRDLDYVVIDAGSTDGTLEVLRSYRDRLRWLSQPDRGQADGTNKGVALTRGQIVGWLNSDDVYVPGTLERVARVFAAQGEADVVYGEAEHVSENGRVVGLYPTAPFDYERLAGECFICQPATFVTRTAFEEVGGLDPDLHYCMDYDLWIRLGWRHRFAYLPERLARSRLHQSAKTLAQRGEAFRETIRMVYRHYGFIPFSWVYAYMDFRMNPSSRRVLGPKRRSLLAYNLAVAYSLWLNRRRPRYWGSIIRDAVKRGIGYVASSATVPDGANRTRGSW